MKNINFFAILIAPLILMSCQNQISGLSREDALKWYSESSWNKLGVKIDESSDIVQFVQQNMISPKAWKAAYEFISGSDFNSMDEGRYDLTNDGVFATVTDYTTKDSAYFESHMKYIDIQYVFRGREYIELSDSGNRTIIEKYDKNKDIDFFEARVSERILADSSKFAVLFPGEAHKPCMKVGIAGPVRKIVVKIPYLNVK